MRLALLVISILALAERGRTAFTYGTYGAHVITTITVSYIHAGKMVYGSRTLGKGLIVQDEATKATD